MCKYLIKNMMNKILLFQMIEGLCFGQGYICFPDVFGTHFALYT